jgi:hypothetical protein
MGDFNLIYQDEDKSLGNMDRIIMHRFRKTLNHLEVKEVRLNGRKYTWSNRQANPTMSRIDRAFSSVEWEQWYPKPYLQALTSSTSDHYSLLLSPLDNPALKPRFRFESFWTAMPGFFDIISQAWNRSIHTSLNPLNTLHTKLGRTAKALKAWAKSLFPQTKVAMTICREVIHQLETTQESRPLSPEEGDLISTLNFRIMGLAAIEKSRARSKSRLTWLRKGGANTRYFQVMANVRKQKKITSTPFS